MRKAIEAEGRRKAIWTRRRVWTRQITIQMLIRKNRHMYFHSHASLIRNDLKLNSAGTIVRRRPNSLESKEIMDPAYAPSSLSTEDSGTAAASTTTEYPPTPLDAELGIEKSGIHGSCDVPSTRKRTSLSRRYLTGT